MAGALKNRRMKGGRAHIRFLFIEAPLKGWKIFGDTVSPYTGYALLGSLLEKNGIEIDAWFGYNRTFEEMEEKVKEYSPDVVGIGVATAWANESLEAVRRVRKLNPEIVTILGGYHVTYLPELYAKDPSVDFIVIGEGEYTLLELVQEIGKPNPRFRDIRGLAFYEDGEYIRTPPRPLAKTLDEFPMPAYHILHIKKDVKEPDRFGNYLEVLTSRGCAMRCHFCSEWKMYNGTFRTRSPGRVIEEFELLHNTYGVTAIEIADDNFQGERRRVEELIHGLLERKLPIQWGASARVDNIIRDRDLLPKMKEAGYISSVVGIESYSDEVLRRERKGITFSQTKEAFRLLREHGIGSIGTYIIGWPSDTRETIKRARDALEEIKPDILIISLLTPWPGSETWDEALENGDILDFNFAHYDLRHPLLRIPYLSPRELIELRNWIYEHHYVKSKIMQILYARDPHFGDTIRAYFDCEDKFYEEYSDENIVKTLDHALHVEPEL